MAPKGRIVIDSERCKGCELCVNVCPHDAIRMAEIFNSQGYRPAEWFNSQGECTGCASCAVICPDAAITVFRQVVTSEVPVVA